MEYPERNSGESREIIEKNDLVVQEFLHITPEELATFRDRVERAGGHVRIAVHPLYVGKNPKTFKSFSGEKLEDVHTFLENGFVRTVRSVHENQSSAPLVVFEEKSEAEETKQHIRRIIGETQEKTLASLGFLICPTENGFGGLPEDYTNRALDVVENTPRELSYDVLRAKLASIEEKLQPLVDAIDKNKDPSNKEPFKAYHEALPLREERSKIEKIFRDRITSVFKSVIQSLHARSVLVLGAYFFTDTHHFDKQIKKLSGCAGGIVENLRSMGILVDISKFSWAPRNELKAKGHETKQTRKKWFT